MSLDNTSIEVICSGLQYPEGPIHCKDGSIILVELKGQCLTMVSPDGQVQKIASMNGSPNGAAVGPDGDIYVTNSGGFDWIPMPLPNGQTILVTGNQPSDYVGGLLQKVTPSSGEVSTVYTECSKRFSPEGKPAAPDWNPAYKLCGLDDIVFDDAGGMWFTDYGKNRERDSDVTGVYYASPDGSSITQMVYPLDEPNGIGLSPDGKRLYVALTFARKVIYFELSAPGVIKPNPADVVNGSYLLTADLEGQSVLDSMAVDSQGNVYVATMLPEGNNPMSNGGISIISPDGKNVEFVPVELPNKEFVPLPSNICFGGEDMKTAYITCGGSGHLISMRSSVAGLKLNHNGSAFDNSSIEKK